MEKTYNPNAIEQTIYRNWEEKKYFRPSMDASKPAFSICLPPPNVTGSLHMGHAFQQTIMDILIRYHRMLGDTVICGPSSRAIAKNARRNSKNARALRNRLSPKRMRIGRCG